MTVDPVAEAITRLAKAAEQDNLEHAVAMCFRTEGGSNVVDGLYAISESLERIADALEGRQ